MSTEPAVIAAITPDDVTGGFDLDASWALDPRVSVRPEPFGALLYHFGTRRLSFLKDPRLRTVVTGLADAPSARAACSAAEITDAELPSFASALQRLADSDMLHRRHDHEEVRT